MGFFSDLGQQFGLSKGNNPADAAMPYLNQIPGTIKPYYDPYIKAGKNSLAELQKQYSDLVNNTGSVMNTIGSGYQKSPGYQFQYDQAMQGADNAAAAGGMIGTPMHQQESATLANNLANQDYYKYFGNAMDAYNRGLTGYEGLNTMGYQASTGLADSLAANLMNQGNMAYLGQNNQNAQKSAGIGNLLQAGGALLGKFI